MLERRQLPEKPRLLRRNGRVQRPQLDARLRRAQFQPRGAKIEFENSAILPDRVDFEIARRGLSCLARLVWRDRNTAGLMFSEEREMGDVVPLDWARKLRASERTNRRLKSRLDQLLSEH